MQQDNDTGKNPQVLLLQIIKQLASNPPQKNIAFCGAIIALVVALAFVAISPSLLISAISNL